MVHILAKMYIIFFIGFTFFITFVNKFELKRKQLIIFWEFFALSLSIVAYNMNPSFDWDISRHFIYMDQIRNSGMSFFYFLVNADSFEYSNYICFNILRYIVVRISDNNLLISAICTFIFYNILGYVIVDWSESNKRGYKYNIVTLLLSFTFMPYIFIVSGLRNGLCAGIMGLAAYLYLYKNKSIVWLLSLFFMAVTIHSAALMTLPFIFIAKLKIGKLGYIAVFIFSYLVQYIAKFLSGSNIYFLSLIGRKYISYSSGSQYRAGRFTLYGDLIVIAIFLLIYFLLYKGFNKEEISLNKKTLFNFLALYMLYILGNIGNYDLVLRPAYVLGSLSPVLSSFFTDKEVWTYFNANVLTKTILKYGLYIGCVSICCYVVCKFHIIYSGNF